MAEFILPEPAESKQGSFVLPDPVKMPPSNWMDQMIAEEQKDIPKVETVVEEQKEEVFNLPEPKEITTDSINIFGTDFQTLEKAGKKVKTILDVTISDVKHLYTDLLPPEGSEVPGSKEEKDFYGFATENIPTNEVGFIDFPQLYADSGNSAKEVAKTLSKHAAKTLLKDIRIGGGAVIITPFAPIQGAISAIGQTTEEIVKDTIGQEGWNAIESKLFGSNTLDVEDIKEGIEAFAHIALIDQISKAPKISNKQYFNQLANETKIKVKDKIADVVADEVIKKDKGLEVTVPLPATKETVKAQIKETLDKADQKGLEIAETETIKQTEKPVYIEDSVQAAANFNYDSKWNPGSKHQKVVIGEIEAQPGGPKKVLTRQKVLSDFINDMQVPIAEGRIKSKKTMGQFFPKYEEIRIKHKGDIDVAAHEIGHFLDKRFDSISNKYKEPDIKIELRDISYDKDVTPEGFAEFIRLYLAAPETAEKVAPKFFEWFDSKLRNDEFVTKVAGKERSIKKAILKAQNNFSGYFKQSAEQRLESKIGYTEAINSKVGSWQERYRSNLIDDLMGLERFEKNIGTDAYLYKKASGLRSGEATFRGAVEYGIPTFRYDPKLKEDIITFDRRISLKKALDQVGSDINNWIKYAVARSAKELKDQGRERLFTKTEIEAGLKLENPTLRKAFQEVQDWQKGIAKFARDYGKLFTEEQMAKWRRTEFLPFWRVHQGMPGSKGKSPKEFTGIKALTGGRENLKPILENIQNNARMLIAEAIKNRIKLDLLAKAREYRAEGTGRFIIPRSPVAKGTKIEKALTKDIKDKFFENLNEILPGDMTVKDFKGGSEFLSMLDRAWEDMGPLTKVITVGKRPKGTERLMPVIDKGKVKYYEVQDPLLFRAIQGLDKKSPLLKGVFNVFSFPKKLGQATITLVPDFIVANGARDTIMASMMTNSGYKVGLDAVRGLKSRMTKDPNYMEWYANGGPMGGYYVNEAAFRAGIEKFYTAKGINFKKVATSPLKFIKLVEEIASTVEQASRLGEFRKSRLKGETVVESIYRSKEVSVAFDKRGAYEGNLGTTLQFLNESVMFLRPAILGIDRVYRGFTKDPHRTKIAGKTIMIGGVSATLAALNYVNPLYQQLEDWDKDTHWHIFIPNNNWANFLAENGRLPHNTIEEVSGYDAETGGFTPMYSHWRIPKIWEIGAIASIGERMITNMFDHPTLYGYSTKTLKDTYRILLEQFRLNPMPQLLVPPFEIMINKNQFTGRPIEILGEEQLAPELRGEGRTSRTVRKIGETLNLSPPQIEALLRGYFNTMGSYGLLLSDQFFFNDSEDLSLNKYPVIRRFRKEIPVRNTKYVTQAYELIDEITTAFRSGRELINRFEPNRAYTYFLDAKHRKKATQTEKSLNKFNKQIQNVDNIRRLTMLQDYAKLLGPSMGRSNYAKSLKDAEVWDDIGALKKYLKNDLYFHRNKIAERFATMIEREKNY